MGDRSLDDVIGDDLEGNILSKVSKNSVENITLISRVCGIPVGAYKRKKDAVAALVERICAALRNHTNQASRPMISIDVGVKNMAVAHYRYPDFHVQQLYLTNLQADSTFSGRTLPAEYARKVLEFVDIINAKVASSPYDSEPLYLIEQQMQKQNVKCCIIEAQLHAYLYPKCISISPRSVSTYFDLTSLPKNLEFESRFNLDVDAYLEKPIAKSYFKKKVTVELIKNLLHHDVLTADECVYKAFNVEKKDDFADAILNGLAFLLWERKLVSLGLQILTGK